MRRPNEAVRVVVCAVDPHGSRRGTLACKHGTEGLARELSVCLRGLAERPGPGFGPKEPRWSGPTDRMPQANPGIGFLGDDRPGQI
jgi:hypothetical protein